MKLITKFGLVLSASATLFGVVVGAAFAGSGTSTSGYGGVAGTITGSVKSGGTLPFTGMDLSLAAGAAVLAVIVGVAIRRFSQSQS